MHAHTHTIQDALRVVQHVLRAADNAIALSKLQGCPLSVDEGHMVRVDLFNVYTTHKKKKLRELHVFLHRNFVIFTHAECSEAGGVTAYQYIESLRVRGEG